LWLKGRRKSRNPPKQCVREAIRAVKTALRFAQEPFCRIKSKKENKVVPRCFRPYTGRELFYLEEKEGWTWQRKKRNL
jgi:hypothetical protein